MVAPGGTFTPLLGLNGKNLPSLSLTTVLSAAANFTPLPPTLPSGLDR